MRAVAPAWSPEWTFARVSWVMERKFDTSAGGNITVQVGTDGMIRDVELRRSSGFDLLDEQALTIVRRVAKVFVPFRLRGREHAVTVPVGFYLKEA